jgi:plastocyanin
MQRIQWLFCAIALGSALASAQPDTSPARADVRLRLAFPQAAAKRRIPPAVLWLKPLPGTPTVPAPAHGQYMLVQKNRMFMPHLLVVPVGSVVQFPNKDPFFHDVFSQFDGKRFDLGLYEAGTTREVTFSREGVSYIFCNIHPEMSAVVLALTTPVYAIADTAGTFQLRNVPAGEYEMHLWVEGTPQPEMEHLVRDVHIANGTTDLGEVEIPAVPQKPGTHLNKFGRPYDEDSKPSY